MTVGVRVALVVAALVGAVATGAPGGLPRAGAGPATVYEQCLFDSPVTFGGDPTLAGILTNASGGAGGGFYLNWPASSLIVPGVRPSGTIHVQVAFTVDADDIAARSLRFGVKPALFAFGGSTAGALGTSAALTVNLTDVTATLRVPDNATFSAASASVTAGGPTAEVDTSSGDLVLTLGPVTGSARQPGSASTPVPTSTPVFTVTIDTEMTIGDLAYGSLLPLDMGDVSFGLGADVPATTGFEVTAVDDQVRTAGTDGTVDCTSGGTRFASPLVTKVAPFGHQVDFLHRQYRDFADRDSTADEATAFYGRLAGPLTAAEFITDLRRNTNDVHSDAVTVVDPVTRLYFAYFGRPPDAGGLDYWLQRKRAGRSLASISSVFAASSEFKTKYGTLTNRQFVTRIYTDVLGRAPDTAGVNFWTGRLDRKVANRGGVMTGFSESSEYKRKKADAVDVAVIWISMLHARPSTTDFDAWVAALAGPAEVGDLIDFVLASPSYEASAAS